MPKRFSNRRKPDYIKKYNVNGMVKESNKSTSGRKKTKTNKRGLTIYQITTHFKSNLGTVPTRKNHA